MHTKTFSNEIVVYKRCNRMY